MNEDGTGATFRERSTWATLSSTLVIYGGLFLAVLPDPTNAVRTAVLWAIAVVLQVAWLVVTHVGIALGSPQEPDDERLLDIERRSTRHSDWVIGGGVLLGVAALLAQQVAHQVTGLDGSDSTWLHPMLVVQWLLLAFVASEVVRLATTAVDHRFG